MAKKIKRLCKWDGKDINKNFKKFTGIVKKPKYVCKKCGWAAAKKTWLHDPAAL